MKKLLLIAALAAIAFGANADGYKLEKVWDLQNPQAVTGLDRLEIRQGFGMDGKFYVNSKKLVVDTIDGVPTVTTAPTIFEIDENGLTGVTFPGGKNCGITRDEAGNIIVSLTQFPNGWTEGLRVINPATGESVEYDMPEEAAIIGRCDFLSFAKGNFFEDGEIWLTGGTQGTGFSHWTISGGELNVDECYYMVGSGVTATTSTVINPYTDINGDDVLLYVTRNDNPKKIAYDGDQYTAATVALPPGKSNTNGMFPFVWDGKELFLYSILNDANQHYMDGFAIAEAGAEAPIVSVPCVATTVNGFQGNWLNAEVDANGVTIYQYFPGNEAGHFTVWRLTKDEPQPEIPNVYILGEVNEQGWAPNVGLLMEYDADNGVYTANVKLDGRGQDGENYFSFTTELAEYNDDGSWAYIAPFRFGAVSEGDFVYDDTMNDTPLSLTYDNPQAFRANGGNYEIIVNLNDMTVTMHHWLMGDANHDKVIDVSDVTALIAAVLGNTPEGFFFDEGNCSSEDDLLDVSDVTALIAIVLGN